MPDALIGPYQIFRQLGEGGMGVVYHARQLHPIRRDVALKIIKPGMDSKQVIARFEAERQALALMDHPNIAHVFDAGTTGTGLPYFVMELVDGVPITRYCDSKRATVKERLELFIPVCRAIQHAHQKGIIHRDLKPSNILIAEQEGKPAPKVIDFGLAKAIGHQLNDASMMTNLGTVVGTLNYMSPEQAELTRQDIDTRSDVYSLGAVLYELLTGSTPFESEQLAKAGYVEALQSIREMEAVPPSARLRRSPTSDEIAAQRQSDAGRLPKLLRGELDWIAMKALEKDRTRRYETVNSLARDLERYLAGEPVEAAPPSAAYRISKFARKHRVGLATAAGFALLLLAGVVASTWMAVRASRAEKEAHAVNDFLRNDLLAQASAYKQARPDTKPDPDLKVRTALDRAADRIEGKFAAQPLVAASIRQTIAVAYWDLGVYPAAQKHFERALQLRRSTLGEKNVDTLTTMENLADVYRLEGKYSLAEPLYTKAIEIGRRVLGEGNPNTLDSLNGMAGLYMIQGKYQLAEPILTKILDTSRRLQGGDDPKTLSAANNLAVVYWYEEKNQEAESLLNSSLEAYRRVLGDEHPDTLNTMSNLATLYDTVGKFPQAESLETKVLDIQRRVLGPEHPRTLNTLANLGSLYDRQGKYEESVRTYTQVLEIQRRVLGQDHPLTLQTLDHLAMAYQHEGNYAQAEPMLTQVLETRRRVLGAQNRDTLFAMSDLAWVYADQGKYAEAERLFTETLAASRTGLGNDYPDTIRAKRELAEILIRRQRYSEAEPLLRDALRVLDKTKPNDWFRYRCQSVLGASLAGQKKYAEAEPLLLTAYDGMLKLAPNMSVPQRKHLRLAGERVVKFYRDSGQPAKAAEWESRLGRETGPSR